MEHLRALATFFNEKDETLKLRVNEDTFAHIESLLLPHVLRVLQKDATLFAEIELFPGTRALWDNSEEGWKRVQMALLYSVLRGDPKEKFKSILDALKGMLPGGNTQADEISAILEDEETQNSLQEFLELVMNTRLLSLVGEIAQSLEYADLGLNFEKPEELLEMLRNPAESPVLKELAERAQQLLEEKLKSGKLNQQELVREIETLRAKFQSSFGRYLNEMVTGTPGNTTGNTSAAILSNSPEARRARMLARLQKKQREKGRR